MGMNIQEISKLCNMLNSKDLEMVLLGVMTAHARFREILNDPSIDEHDLRTQIKYVLSHNNGSIYGINLWSKTKNVLARLAYIEGLKIGDLWKLQQKLGK